jgi:uncharacterized protein YjbJ (UPF0337 family)
VPRERSRPCISWTGKSTRFIWRRIGLSSAQKIEGDLKDAAGKALGDQKLQAEGKADKAKGKIKNAGGGIKDTVRDALDPDKQ